MMMGFDLNSKGQHRLVQTTGRNCLLNCSAQPPPWLGHKGSAPGPSGRCEGKAHRKDHLSPISHFTVSAWGKKEHIKGSLINMTESLNISSDTEKGITGLRTPWQKFQGWGWLLCVLGTEKITINLEISFFLFRKKKRRLEFFPYTFFPPIGFLKRNEKKKRKKEMKYPSLISHKDHPSP